MTPNVPMDFPTEPIKAGKGGDPQAAGADVVAVARVLPKYLRNSGSGALLGRQRGGEVYHAPLLAPALVAMAALTRQVLA